jgi:hypothetical protein
MKAGENIRYLMFLENTIKSQKKKSVYYPSDLGFSYRSDIQSLLNHTLAKHPELVNTEADIEVDPKKLPLITKENLVEYLKRSRKGAVCYYRDEDGQTRIMVNAGPGYGLRKNRVLFFPESLKDESPENFRRILRRALVQKDIEFVYRNLQKRQEKTRAPQEKLFPAKKSVDNASSAFERNFKALVKEAGGGANPMKTARSMVLAMPGNERSKLNSALQRMNIKNGAELEALLVQWKYEALSPEQSASKKQNRRIGLARA